MHSPATKEQKKLIQVNKPTKDIKEEWVQWATRDEKKTSCNDLSFDQANDIIEKIIRRPRHTWGDLNQDSKQHRYIFNLAKDAFGKRFNLEKKRFEPDYDRLSDWLKSARCPVQKPVRLMSTAELSKVISALSGIIKNKYK